MGNPKPKTSQKDKKNKEPSASQDILFVHISYLYVDKVAFIFGSGES